jgi:putative peptide zinc metalloprotease protein
VLRAQPPLARRGWRRWAYLLSGGLVRLGQSTAEQREAERMLQVRTPIIGSRRVVVLSRKGGVGKTTTALMLGHTFATHRGDRVVALDGDPDAGSLGYRVRRETAATVTNLLADSQHLERYASIRGYTSQAPTRLEVVAADDDPSVSEALGHGDYQQAIRLLDRHYNLILLDAGTGILDSATQGILGMADQLVLVLAPSLDSARAASLTLDWLDAHGYGHLVREAVAVVNQVRPRTAIQHDIVDEHFRLRCRAVVRIPWDPQLEAGAQTGLDELRPQTRDAYLDLAAEVAEGFPNSAPQRAG